MGRSPTSPKASRPLPRGSRHVVGVYAWRFFSGHHMDGRIRCRNGRIIPGHVDYWWNRWPRRRKIIWRNSIFWGGLAVGGGFLISAEDTLLAAGYVLAFLAGRGYQAAHTAVRKPADVHAVQVSVPVSQVVADEQAIDVAVAQETETNVAEIASSQVPRRKRRVV